MSMMPFVRRLGWLDAGASHSRGTGAPLTRKIKGTPWRASSRLLNLEWDVTLLPQLIRRCSISWSIVCLGMPFAIGGTQ